MKIGVDINKLKEGTYIIIPKQRFIKFMNSIKNEETYNKVKKFLNTSEIEVKD